MSKYQLIETPIGDIDIFKVTIVADSNDGDYITTISTYTKSYFEENIVDVLIDLGDNYRGEGDLNDFDNDYIDVPCGEYGSCHTLESIDVKYVDKERKIWNVELASTLEEEE